VPSSMALLCRRAPLSLGAWIHRGGGRLPRCAVLPLPVAPPPFVLAAVRARPLSTVPAAISSAAEVLPAPSPPSRFAVVQLGSSQYKVAPDDLICVEKIALSVGAELAARRVLLVGEAGATVIGSPLIEGACVHAMVEEQGYGDKVIIFKKRRRKGYRRWKGFRSRLTMLRILAIELPPSMEAALAAPPE